MSASLPEPLTVQLRREGATQVLVVAGELDLAGVPLVRQRSDEALAEQPSAVVVDLAGLSFLDSSGLGALLELAGRARDAGVALRTRAPLGGEARVLMELTGTAGLLRLET